MDSLTQDSGPGDTFMQSNLKQEIKQEISEFVTVDEGNQYIISTVSKEDIYNSESNEQGSSPHNNQELDLKEEVKGEQIDEFVDVYEEYEDKLSAPKNKTQDCDSSSQECDARAREKDVTSCSSPLNLHLQGQFVVPVTQCLIVALKPEPHISKRKSWHANGRERCRSRSSDLAVDVKETRSVTVSELQQLNFAKLSLQEKVAIKTRGRSSPDIQISQPGISNKKKYIRSFNSEWYRRKSWLCGCEERRALFCFPCLLFGGDITWTKEGFRNISKMKDKTEKHEKSKQHIENVISLSLLETVSIKDKLGETYRCSIKEHNRKVVKNREILSKIIDCILYCGNFESLLPKQDEKEASVYPSVFREFLNFASKLDPDLKNQLETSMIFKDVSKTMQTEILDCLLQIYHEEIKKEIRESSFVAVILDDTTEVSEHTQLALVLRYVFNDELYEHFWGFLNPESQTAEGVSESILEELDVILQGNGQKLIAHTYDGSNILKSQRGVVQANIKAIYSNSHFVHCYTHNTNIIMRNAAGVSRDSRIFFSNILAISTFFSNSEHRVSILKKHMNHSIQNSSSTRWNFSIQTLNKVHDNLQPLKNCLTELQLTSNTDHTISEATGILQYINNDKFTFWLDLFHQIMPHVETICQQMQSRKINMIKATEYLNNFRIAILELKNSKYCENPSKIIMAEAKDICDHICVDMMHRYSFINILLTAKLFNQKSFPSFKKKLPKEEIALTTQSYPVIDKEKLETELKVFYSRSEMHDYCKLMNLLKFISENNLDVAFSEISKLIKILLTVPMATSEPDRCFSTVKKIKHFLRSSLNQERLNALAVLSVEKEFLTSHPNFKDNVIKLFAQNQTRRKDFILR